MPANRYIVDGGGVTRHIKKRYAVDSGGVTRLIKKRYVVDSGGTTRLTYQYGNHITLTAGTATFATGYQTVRSPFYGSVAPSATLVDGKTLYLLTTGTPGNPTTVTLYIGGFSSNPGSAYVASLTVDGVTLIGASAGTYSYGPQSGITVAQWIWSNISALAFASGNSYPVVLITD